MWNEILTGLVALVSGGGLSALILLPISRKKFQAEAMKEVQDVYQETVADLRADKRLMKEELTDLSNRVTNLDNQLRQNTIEIVKLKRNECIRFSCRDRLKSKR